jgi:hypothetical protein
MRIGFVRFFFWDFLFGYLKLIKNFEHFFLVKSHKPFLYSYNIPSIWCPKEWRSSGPIQPIVIVPLLFVVYRRLVASKPRPHGPPQAAKPTRRLGERKQTRQRLTAARARQRLSEVGRGVITGGGGGTELITSVSRRRADRQFATPVFLRHGLVQWPCRCAAATPSPRFASP